MRFHLKFDSPDDAAAFSQWCAENDTRVRETWADGAPYPPGRILEVSVSDDESANAFVELWAAWIVGIGAGF